MMKVVSSVDCSVWLLFFENLIPTCVKVVYFRTFFSPPNQMTPLHVAAKNGRFGLVKLLVNKKANINNQDNDGVSNL